MFNISRKKIGGNSGRLLNFRCIDMDLRNVNAPFVGTSLSDNAETAKRRLQVFEFGKK